MKRTINFLTLFLALYSAHAQRQVDLSCEAVLKPDTVFGYQPTYCSMIAKNNGPDTLYADDTIAYAFIMPGNGLGDIYFPPTGAYYKKIDKSMYPGDSLFIDKIIPSIIVHKTDYNEFSGSVYIHRDDSNFYLEERSSKLSNNSKTIHIWYMGDNVSSEGELLANVNIYPSVAEKEINIESSAPLLLISFMDLSGQLVKNFKPNACFNYNLGLDGLEAGLYFVKVQTANNIYSKKIIKL